MLLIRAKLRWDNDCGAQAAHNAAHLHVWLSTRLIFLLVGPKADYHIKVARTSFASKALNVAVIRPSGRRTHWTQTKSRKGPTDGLSLHGQIQVLDLFVHHCLGNTVVSMCGGSGSLMEACMLQAVLAWCLNVMVPFLSYYRFFRQAVRRSCRENACDI